MSDTRIHKFRLRRTRDTPEPPLNPGRFSETAQETVRFGVDGTEYEIDLTTENAQKLRSTLGEYADKARKASTRRGQASKSPAATGAASGKAKREETQRIRQWAQENGHSTSARGRISQSIVDAYNQAH